MAQMKAYTANILHSLITPNTLDQVYPLTLHSQCVSNAHTSLLPSLFTIYCITCNDYIRFTLTFLIIFHKLITHDTHSYWFIAIALPVCNLDACITLFYTQFSMRKSQTITAKYTQPLYQIEYINCWIKQIYFQLLVLAIKCIIHITFKVTWLKDW